MLRIPLVLVACLALVSLACADQGNRRTIEISFEDWLGPQTNENATVSSPVVGTVIDSKSDRKLSRYDVSLKLVRGKDIEIPASDNPVVTLVDGQPAEVKKVKLIDNRIYLVGRVQLKPKQLGWRFYTLNLRVKKGPLKGAVVHLRDGSLQNSIRDACIAVYPIPREYGIRVGEGQMLPIDFEIVAQFSK